MRLVSRILVVFLLLALVSCSGKKKEGGGDDKKGGDKGGEKGQVSELEMKVVALALMKATDDADTKGKPLSKVDELKGYLAADVDEEATMAKLRSGEITVVLGFSLPAVAKAPGGLPAHVIAHEKDAATKGGYVAMGDVSVKKVTAEEFKTLKLAPKK